MNWYLHVLQNNYLNFSGRAHRTEFWTFILINLAISIVLSLIDFVLGWIGPFGGALGTLYSLAVLLPTIGVTVRRLHDTGRTGLWYLLVFVPFIGALVLLFFCIMESQPGANQYGPSPHGA